MVRVVKRSYLKFLNFCSTVIAGPALVVFLALCLCTNSRTNEVDEKLFEPSLSGSSKFSD